MRCRREQEGLHQLIDSCVLPRPRLLAMSSLSRPKECFSCTADSSRRQGPTTNDRQLVILLTATAGKPPRLASGGPTARACLDSRRAASRCSQSSKIPRNVAGRRGKRRPRRRGSRGGGGKAWRQFRRGRPTTAGHYGRRLRRRALAGIAFICPSRPSRSRPPPARAAAHDSGCS